jgi:hypothetical protein
MSPDSAPALQLYFCKALLTFAAIFYFEATQV